MLLTGETFVRVFPLLFVAVVVNGIFRDSCTQHNDRNENTRKLLMRFSRTVQNSQFTKSGVPQISNTFQAWNMKRDKWLSSPSHFSSFNCSLSVVLYVDKNCPENWHVVFCPNKKHPFEPFVCLDFPRRSNLAETALSSLARVHLRRCFGMLFLISAVCTLSSLFQMV